MCTVAFLMECKRVELCNRLYSNKSVKPVPDLSSAGFHGQLCFSFQIFFTISRSFFMKRSFYTSQTHLYYDFFFFM